jgi:hypothetical protein
VRAAGGTGGQVDEMPVAPFVSVLGSRFGRCVECANTHLAGEFPGCDLITPRRFPGLNHLESFLQR